MKKKPWWENFPLGRGNTRASDVTDPASGTAWDHVDMAVWREYVEQFPHEDPPVTAPSDYVPGGWKMLAPSEKQAAYLRRKNVPVPATRGEASERIKRIIADEDSERLGRRAVADHDDAPDFSPRDFGDL